MKLFRIHRMRFNASRSFGASIVSAVFTSLPLEGEESAWSSAEEAAEYCRNYPRDRMDVGGYYFPSVGPANRGVVSIETASRRRLVSFDSSAGEWTIDFGSHGSSMAAAELLVAAHSRGIEPEVE